MTKLLSCFLFTIGTANQIPQKSNQTAQVVNQTPQISNQQPQISNQQTQISNQQPQISNQHPQISNQKPQISHQECRTVSRATCNFSEGNGEDGIGTIQGILNITEYRNCRGGAHETTFSGRLSGSSSNFLPGLHGLHVHESNDLSDCSQLGAHFSANPTSIHGRPFLEEPFRHAGDLGNVLCSENQIIDVFIQDRTTSLDKLNPYSIVGRGMVLHAGEDDFNPEGTSDSTGNAGSRVGCCVISSFVETEDI